MGRILEWQKHQSHRTADSDVRFKGIYLSICWLIATGLLVIGGGLIVGGDGARTGHVLDILVRAEGGNLSPVLGVRVHGLVLIVLGLCLAWTLADFRLATLRALMAIAFYTVLTSLMIFASWVPYGVSWSAPWLYLFPSTACLILLFFAPPLGPDGRRYGVTSTGSDSA